MSTQARPALSPPPRALALRIPALESDAFYALALGVVLAWIAVRGSGGLGLSDITTVEIVLDLGAAVVGISALLAVDDWRHTAWGWASVGLFALFVVASAVSTIWSVAPDQSWIEANRLVTYLAVFAGALALVRLAPHRWTALLAGVTTACVAVSLWALAHKAFPAWLEPDETYARLREPFGYWNAVGLMAALGVPGCLWLGARRTGHAMLNAAAFPATALLIIVILLAYSRGALLALLIGAAFWFATVPLRLRGIAVLIGGSLGAVAVIAWAFGQDALTQDKVPLALRDQAGHQLFIAVLFLLLLLYAVGLAVGFVQERYPLAERARRRAGTAVAIGLCLIPLAGVAALAASSRGLTGTISHDLHTLTDTSVQGITNSPNRLTAVGSVRARYWNDALKIFSDHPWFGVGTGGYETARLRYRTDSLDVQHAHGYVVQVLADRGLVGLLLSLAALAALSVAIALATGLTRVGRRAGGAAAASPERIGLLTLTTIVVVFGVHSFVDWTWFIPGVAIPALLAGGWLAGRGVLALPPRAPGRLWVRARAGSASPIRVFAAAAVLAVAVSAAWAAWQPQRSVDAGNDALGRARHQPAAARHRAQAGQPGAPARSAVGRALLRPGGDREPCRRPGRGPARTAGRGAPDTGRPRHLDHARGLPAASAQAAPGGQEDAERRAVPRPALGRRHRPAARGQPPAPDRNEVARRGFRHEMRRLLTTLAALALLAPAAAQASTTQESYFQDDDHLEFAPADQVARTLDKLKSLGVDRCASRCSGRRSHRLPTPRPSPRASTARTPTPMSRPSGSATTPSSGSPPARGMGVMFDIAGPAPNWATGTPQRRDLDTVWRPDAGEFAAFVRGVGTRYSGTYLRPADRPKTTVIPGHGTPGPLGGYTPPKTVTTKAGPRSGASIPGRSGTSPTRARGWLPSGHGTVAAEVATSPRIYRGLADAMYGALGATGHGSDTILVGATAPKGLNVKGVSRAMKPVTFIRALYCVDAHNQPLAGRAASLDGCPASDPIHQFPAQHPVLFKATGFSHHPYELTFAPDHRPPDPLYLTIANLRTLSSMLRFAYLRYLQPVPATGVPLYLTEFGYQTNPPDELGVSPGQQAAYLDEAEYITWRNPSVRALSQFLLVDGGPPVSLTFQTGLEFRNGRAKPAMRAYRLPIWLPRRSARRGSRIRVWGLVRPAANGSAPTVGIQFRAKGRHAWRTLATYQGTADRGYLYHSVRLPGTGSIRLLWNGATSRSVGVRAT